MSADNSQTHWRLCAAAGANDAIAKPFSVEILANRIRFWATVVDACRAFDLQQPTLPNDAGFAMVQA